MGEKLFDQRKIGLFPGSAFGQGATGAAGGNVDVVIEPREFVLCPDVEQVKAALNLFLNKEVSDQLFDATHPFVGMVVVHIQDGYFEFGGWHTSNFLLKIRQRYRVFWKQRQKSG